MAATTSPLAGSKVFEPLKLGAIELTNRGTHSGPQLQLAVTDNDTVVMAPLTRGRSPEHIPDENVVTYYQQRAYPGALIISEAVHISVMVLFLRPPPSTFSNLNLRAETTTTSLASSPPSRSAAGRKSPTPSTARADSSTRSSGTSAAPHTPPCSAAVNPSAPPQTRRPAVSSCSQALACSPRRSRSP